jgi:multidrug efflux pump subunit AcrB
VLDGLTLVANGHLAPLTSIASLRPGPTAVRRSREDLRQVVRITARLEGRDVGSAMADVRSSLQRDLRLPPGVTLEYGGLYASQQAAFRELATVLFLALLAVGALLVVEFGSFSAVIAIIAGSSLALSGSLAALWATGTALNVSSLVGMIMVVGIVAKNGILLLDFARREELRDGDVQRALVQAGQVRLRPILMTTLAAAAGLAPLALGIGAGAEMQQPLAIAILGGIALSMLFSMLGVPILYARLVARRGEG